jgi:hypothetical protein
MLTVRYSYTISVCAAVISSVNSAMARFLELYSAVSEVFSADTTTERSYTRRRILFKAAAFCFPPSPCFSNTNPESAAYLPC